MTTQISITIIHGTASVTAADKERAEAASLAVLGEADPSASYSEYQQQWTILDSEDGMTGLARLWAAAARAANIALTEGWYDPAGAACEISA